VIIYQIQPFRPESFFETVKLPVSGLSEGIEVPGIKIDEGFTPIFFA